MYDEVIFSQKDFETLIRETRLDVDFITKCYEANIITAEERDSILKIPLADSRFKVRFFNVMRKKGFQDWEQLLILMEGHSTEEHLKTIIREACKASREVSGNIRTNLLGLGNLTTTVHSFQPTLSSINTGIHRIQHEIDDQKCCSSCADCDPSILCCLLPCSWTCTRNFCNWRVNECFDPYYYRRPVRVPSCQRSLNC